MSDTNGNTVFLIIDGQPIAHVPSEYGYAEALMSQLIDACGGRISIDAGGGYESGDISDVAEALSWCDFHAGYYSFIGTVYDASGNEVEPYILSSQWYVYELPECESEIDRYCVENGLTRPSEMH